MKKIFQKLNSKNIRSIAVGLAVAAVLSAGTSYVGAQGTSSSATDNAINMLSNVSSVIPFPSSASTIVNRIGSLTIGTSTPSSLTGANTNCINADTVSITEESESCIAAGPATFTNLLVEKTAYFLNAVSVGGTAGLDGVSRFIIEDDTTAYYDSGLMVSSLGYSTSGNATVYPTPRDLVTQSGVCATTNGTVERCELPTSATTTPTPVNGACGSADGTTVSSAPTSNLCAAGTASSVSGGAYDSSGTPPYTWDCIGSDGGTTASCSANVESVVVPPSCTAPVIEHSAYATSGTVDGIVTLVSEPAVTSGANGLFSVTFDESVYENVILHVSGPISSNSSVTDVSPVTHGNFGQIEWDVNISADCVSDGTNVTSNTVSLDGSNYVAPTSPSSCNQVWHDGTSFSWGGVGYGYFTPSKVSIDPNTTDYCNTYYINATTDTWAKVECVGANPVFNPTGTQYYTYLNSNSYETNDGSEGADDYVWTNSSGTPYNSSSNYPSYTSNTPEDWFSTGSASSAKRYVPIASACS